MKSLQKYALITLICVIFLMGLPILDLGIFSISITTASMGCILSLDGAHFSHWKLLLLTKYVALIQGASNKWKGSKRKCNIPSISRKSSVSGCTILTLTWHKSYADLGELQNAIRHICPPPGGFRPVYRHVPASHTATEMTSG